MKQLFEKNLLSKNHGAAEVSYIGINPATLTIAGDPLVTSDILVLLKLKQIELQLHVFDSDPDDENKPIMVFLHGNSSSKRVFDSQITRYQEKFRILAIDLLGHGQSSKLIEFSHINEEEKDLLGSAFYSLPALVSEVGQVLKKKNIQEAHFNGWSLGGNIAFALAVECPELVLSIVSTGSPPIPFSTEGLISGANEWFVKTLVPQWIEQPKHTSKDEAIIIRQHMGFDENDSFFIEDMMKTDPLFRKHLFLNIDNELLSKDAQRVLDGEDFALRTNIPLCLIVGDQDKGINHQFIQSFSDKLNNKYSKICTIKQAMHAVFKSNPVEYFDAIEQFYESIALSTKSNPFLITQSDTKMKSFFGMMQSLQPSDEKETIVGLCTL